MTGRRLSDVRDHPHSVAAGPVVIGQPPLFPEPHPLVEPDGGGIAQIDLEPHLPDASGRQPLEELGEKPLARSAAAMNLS